MSHSTPQTFAALPAAVAVLLCACANATEVRQPLSGLYTVTETRSPAACTPNALPAPVSTDTTLYAVVPAAKAIRAFTERIDAVGSRVTLTPLDANGRPLDQQSLRGTIDFVGNGSTSTASREIPPFVEGARTEGHRFVVTEADSEATLYTGIVLTPSAQTQWLSESSHGVALLTFHDAGATGPVFTRCLIADTSVGSFNLP
jgi:hypothetical protein